MYSRANENQGWQFGTAGRETYRKTERKRQKCQDLALKKLEKQVK